MKEFMLLFRQPNYDYSNASAKEMQDLTQKWHDWVEGITSQDKLASQGPRLATEGKVLKPVVLLPMVPSLKLKRNWGVLSL